MFIFSQLKQQLINEFSALVTGQGLKKLQASIVLSEEQLPLLAWLKAQSKLQSVYYPHFFLQHRDCDRAIATVGAVRQFDSLISAQQFVAQYNFTLVGGVQFEGQTQFILPQFAFAKVAKKITACFYFDTDDFIGQTQAFNQILAGLEQLESLQLSENRLCTQYSVCDFAQWKANIEEAMEQIRQQVLSKVVLANATTLTFENTVSAYDLLSESQQTNLGCYHFLWAESAECVFVGSTPERLYRRLAKEFSTEALAGTVAVTQNREQTERNAQWLMTDPKNIYENQLVVDDIEGNLSDCVEQFKVSHAEIKRLHNVQHLRRQIQANLKEGVSDSECLARIHPTAAVAGLPRQSAKQFIAEHEPFQRKWYAGTLGFFNRNEAEFCVTLRSAQIKANQITLYAGAGIVEGSDPQSEWLEIQRKSLGLARLLKVDLLID